MNLYTFVSLVLFSAAAVFALVFSVLTFCGNKRIIDEKVQQRYHVRSYRLHNGFFFLGYSLFAATIAYLSFIDTSWIMIIKLIFVAYGIAGAMYLLKSKHLIKDPSVVIDINYFINELNEMTDKQIKARCLLAFGVFMLFPVTILIGALLLY